MNSATVKCTSATQLTAGVIAAQHFIFWWLATVPLIVAIHIKKGLFRSLIVLAHHLRHFISLAAVTCSPAKLTVSQAASYWSDPASFLIGHWSCLPWARSHSLTHIIVDGISKAALLLVRVQSTLDWSLSAQLSCGWLLTTARPGDWSVEGPAQLTDMFSCSLSSDVTTAGWRQEWRYTHRPLHTPQCDKMIKTQ